MVKKIIVILLLVLLCQSIFAKDADTQKSKVLPGFIFNSENILIDFESYQVGIGLKFKDLIQIKTISCNLRTLLYLDFNNFFDDYSIKMGMALEFPFIHGKRIMPYWGIFADIEYSYLFTQTSETNSIAETYIPISFGGILGAEVFIFEFFSIFAEFNLTGYLLNSIIEVTDPAIPEDEAGPVSSSEFKLRTEMGNKGMIGIIIYFDSAVDLKKK